MKYLLLVSFFFFTLNCSLNKVSNVHGSRFIDTKYDKIVMNKSNKNDVRKLLGPASSESNFDDIWFYIERKKNNQSLFKLGIQKISTNNVIVLKFDEMGIVSNKKLLKLEDMNDLVINEKNTKKKFAQDNALYNILSSVREKVNAPSRRKK